ncbi:MAG TPA: NAD(P)-binding domain-containing protein, partial [Fimbriimonadaceae bacterium]|nr:NAD(P)-binding domain-containing protein [Fimbriimonadaceae bacterium]
RETNVKFGIFGTGVVGKTIAARLDGLGHEVIVGTRDPEETTSRTEPDAYGNPPFGSWQEEHPEVKLGTFEEAAAHGEMVVNATAGGVSLEALELVGEANLNGKVVMDVSNPLDFSQGMPPTLAVSNTDSLGEQIQRRFPGAKVVKTLNTMNAYLMVDPAQLAEADHTVFVSGDDTEAKQAVTELLESFGWTDVIDLGDITTARGTEMLLPVWLRLFGALRKPVFNFKIVR